MGALTIHLDDASRSRKKSRGAVAAALFGGVLLGTILGKTPPTPQLPPKIVEVPVVVTQTVGVPVLVPAPVPAPVVTQTVAPPPPPVAVARTTPSRRVAPRPVPPPLLQPIRPVLDPANIVFRAPGSRMVRVTNPHDRAIKVTRIFILGTGSGYEVDATQCNGQTLVARGGSCTIMITASAEAVQTSARLDLRMTHDSGMTAPKKP
jgi:hypothetical protein